MEDQPDSPFAGLGPLHYLDEDFGFLPLFPDQPEQEMLEPKPSSAPGALEFPINRGLPLQHAASAAALTEGMGLGLGLDPGPAGSSSSPQGSDLAESPTAAEARAEVTSGSPPSQAGRVRGRRGGQRGARSRPASAKGRALRRRETNSTAQRRFRERQKEKQTKMVSDLEVAQKMVADLQAANQILEARITQMEEPYGAVMGQGAPLTTPAGSSSAAGQLGGAFITTTLDELNPQLLSIQAVRDMSAAECGSIWKRYVQQVQECLAAVPETSATVERMGQLLQELQQLLAAFNTRNPLCLQHLLRNLPATLYQPEAYRPNRMTIQATVAGCQLTPEQRRDLLALRSTYMVRWAHLEQQRQQAPLRALLPQASSSSDTSASSNSDMPDTVHKVATEMKRLHAALMKAVLIGILTIPQLAQAVVRSWPCSPDPMAMLELMAEQEGIQGPLAEPVQDSVAIEQGIRLTRYAEELDAARDMGHHVPFLQPEAMQQD
eukprot:jgi/Astpho2/8615/fgenesh1_pg.00126_%23_29_t